VASFGFTVRHGPVVSKEPVTQPFVAVAAATGESVDERTSLTIRTHVLFDAYEAGLNSKLLESKWFAPKLLRRDYIWPSSVRYMTARGCRAVCDL
jgi:hypothetical protein